MPQTKGAPWPCARDTEKAVCQPSLFTREANLVQNILPSGKCFTSEHCWMEQEPDARKAETNYLCSPSTRF